MKQFFLTCCGIILSFLLSACVELEEELWIHADGSGRLQVHQTLPTIAKARIGNTSKYLRLIHEIDQEEDGIDIQELRFGLENNELTFHLEADFKNVLKLQEIFTRHQPKIQEASGINDAQMEAISGEIITKLDGLSPSYKRTINLGDAIPAMVKNRPILLGQSYCKYIIHLPAKVQTTNAHEVSDDQKTLTWNFLMKDYLQEPMFMEFTSDLPTPWWVPLLFILIVLAIGFFFGKKFRRATH